MTRHTLAMFGAAVTFALVGAACSNGSSESAGSSATAGATSTASSGSGGSPGTSSSVGAGGSLGTTSSSGAGGTGPQDGGAPPAGGGVPASCNGDEGGPVPTTPAALQDWLGKRLYQCWAHETAKHPSGGPHGGDVQTFLNEKLYTSLQGWGEHPQGSVSVKELYGGGAEITGWAVLVKTQAASAGGQGYYWSEAFGTQPGANAIEGQGKALCVNCHAAGQDFVLTPFPLN